MGEKEGRTGKEGRKEGRAGCSRIRTSPLVLAFSKVPPFKKYTVHIYIYMYVWWWWWLWL
jgi:hypothetical protein